MKIGELMEHGFTEVRNRIPLGAVAKFKEQKIQGQSGSTVLKNTISRYNCRIIPVASVVIIICTVISLIFEIIIGLVTPWGLAGEILLMFTAVCGIGFGFYFNGKYPAYYPYIYWALFLISYIMRVTSCGIGAEGLAITAVTLFTLCAVPVFTPKISALFIAVSAIYYTIICCVNGVYSYYCFIIIGMGMMAFLVSASNYTLMCTRLINSKQIKDGKERIKLSSVIDGRTGLYNRSYGIDKANEMLKSGANIAILLVDIDSFGEYNRIYGTEQADDTLQRIANCVKIVSKPQTDTICRIDGDRLMVLMSSSSDKDAVLLCEEIRSSVKTMNIDFTENRPKLSVTVSVSAARSAPGNTFDDIYEKALHSLEIAKNAGGNCIGYGSRTFRPDV